MKVVISQAAGTDLENLFFYVAEKAGIVIAETFVGGIHQFLLQLAEFPDLGKRRTSSKVPDLHTFPYKGKTMIAYTVNEKAATVTILGVYHGGQDYETDLEIDSE